jgi:hypothetical protein
MRNDFKMIVFKQLTILIKMLAFDWSMTRWYNTHATGW